jgi:D-aspartate ligase
VPAAVIRTKPYDIAHRSRWASSSDAVLDVEERPEALIELLERRAEQWGGWLLLPTNDGALAAVAQHREGLERSYRVAAPPWEIARRFIEKPRLHELAQSVGLDLPRCYGPAVIGAAALPGLRFPVLVKPDLGYAFSTRFDVKLFVATSREELARCAERLAEAGLSGHIFDWIPGEDARIFSYCVYVDRRGEASAGVAVRKLRQAPPFFGVARVAEIVPEIPELRAATIELARRAGLRGIVSTEFKLDPRDGRFRFIEANARSVLYNGLLRKGGLDLAWLAWRDAVDGENEVVRPTLWPGAWIHLHADLFHSTLYRRQDPIGFAEFLAPYRRPRLDAVWSRRDARPFFAQWAGTAREGFSLLWRGEHRARLADRTRPGTADGERRAAGGRSRL